MKYREVSRKLTTLGCREEERKAEDRIVNGSHLISVLLLFRIGVDGT